MKLIASIALIGSGLLIVYFYSTAQSKDDTPATFGTEDRGTVRVPQVDVPLSLYLSTEAKQRYTSAKSPPTDPLSPLLKRAQAVYPVNVESAMIGGVRTDVVTPKTGISPQNRDRVLVNLHGGAFFRNNEEQLLESIPIASVARIKVISVDYRCAPKYKFPAASEDVASVYKKLLEKYRPSNIGIFGCSAGGILTAESIAWFQKEKLPAPGAIGIFCAADAVEGGDSRYVWGPRPTTRSNPPPNMMPYFDEVNVVDPLVSPTLHADVLRQFPPALLITGSRDFLASPVIYAHTQLVKVGVYAELHVWEGMDHGFFLDVEIPESKEMYDVTARFFSSRLGRPE